MKIKTSQFIVDNTLDSQLYKSFFLFLILEMQYRNSKWVTKQNSALKNKTRPTWETISVAIIDNYITCIVYTTSVLNRKSAANRAKINWKKEWVQTLEIYKVTRMVTGMRSSIDSVWTLTGSKRARSTDRDFRTHSLEALSRLIWDPRNTPERNEKWSKEANEIILPSAPKLRLHYERRIASIC